MVSAKKENTKDLKLGINRPSVSKTSKKETIDENVKVESSSAKEETSTVKEVTTAEEKKIKNPVVYDMSKDGEMIKVLSDSIEKTEGDK